MSTTDWTVALAICLFFCDQRHMDSDLLTSVALVLKRARVTALPVEVVLRLDGFIDQSANWTLETATNAGFVHLLHRLARREWPGVGVEFRKLRYQYGVLNATNNGDLSALKWWASSYLTETPMPLNTAMIFARAAQNGHVHILDWLKVRGLLPSNRFDANPPYTSHPSVVYWIDEQQAMVVDLSLAARTGDLVFLRWIHERPHPRKEVVNWHKVPYLAAVHGHLKLVQWIYENRSSEFGAEVLKGAVVGGHVAIARWVYAKWKFDLPNHLQADDINIEMVTWLKNKFEWPSTSAYVAYVNNAIIDAARLGKLDVLKLLAQDHSLIVSGGQAMERAAGNGHLDIVRSLHGQGVAVNSSAINATIQSGHLQVVKYLHKHYSGEWTEHETYSSVYFGRLEVLKWLYSCGIARFNPQTMKIAAKFGHRAIVAWIHSHTARPVWYSGDEVHLAVSEGRLDVVKWLYENDQDRDIFMAFVVSLSDGRRTLKLVSGNKSEPFDIHLAMRRGFFALVEWLFLHSQG